jgi:hypothetical protein
VLLRHARLAGRGCAACGTQLCRNDGAQRCSRRPQLLFRGGCGHGLEPLADQGHTSGGVRVVLG